MDKETIKLIAENYLNQVSARNFSESTGKVSPPLECLESYVEIIAGEILTKEIAPRAGAKKIYDLCRVLGHPPNLSAWEYLDGNNDSADARLLEKAIIVEAAKIIHKENLLFGDLNKDGFYF